MLSIASISYKILYSIYRVKSLVYIIFKDKIKKVIYQNIKIFNKLYQFLKKKNKNIFIVITELKINLILKTFVVSFEMNDL